MKRKAISNLLQIAEPIGADELLQVLPEDGNEETATARVVLASALLASRRNGVTDPEQFYFGVCSSTAAQLAPVLEGTPAEKLSQKKLIRSQMILKEALTSKAGRPATTGKSRAVQLAEGQRRRREKLKNVEGRKQLNEWISKEAAAYLAAIQEIHGCESRADALEMVLQAAMQGKPLTLPQR